MDIPASPSSCRTVRKAVHLALCLCGDSPPPPLSLSLSLSLSLHTLSQMHLWHSLFCTLPNPSASLYTYILANRALTLRARCVLATQVLSALSHAQLRGMVVGHLWVRIACPLVAVLATHTNPHPLHWFLFSLPRLSPLCRCFSSRPSSCCGGTDTEGHVLLCVQLQP